MKRNEQFMKKSFRNNQRNIYTKKKTIRRKKSTFVFNFLQNRRLQEKYPLKKRQQMLSP